MRSQRGTGGTGQHCAKRKKPVGGRSVSMTSLTVGSVSFPVQDTDSERQAD